MMAGVPPASGRPVSRGPELPGSARPVEADGVLDKNNDFTPDPVVALIRGSSPLLFPWTDMRQLLESAIDGSQARPPGSAAEAIRRVEDARASGASLLLLPDSDSWWLDFYPDLRAFLTGTATPFESGSVRGQFFTLGHPTHATAPHSASPPGAPLTLTEAKQLLLDAASARPQETVIPEVIGELLQALKDKGAVERHFRTWEAYGFHITPAHFYSPIPTLETLPEEIWEKQSELAGLDMREEQQLELLSKAFPQFAPEIARIPMEKTDNPRDFYLNNTRFSGTDALVLFCMIRHHKPKTIIEVGAGLSTRLIAHAGNLTGSRLISIDPRPDDVLMQHFPELSVLPQMVQDIPLDTFKQLGPNDVLFIDSSHVVKTGGDVNYLYLEVLPVLSPGVLVHVHDIFLPREYRRDWVLEEHRFWNEQYLLQAFMAFNSDFEVVLANSYLARRHPEVFRRVFPTSPWWGGGSFWIRRRM